MFTRTDLDTLLAHDEAPALSIFLPTEVAGREVRQNPVRLRNLLAEITERLSGAGMRRPDVLSLLSPARDLAEDEFFWRFQDHGLALFVAPGAFHAFRVPLALEQRYVLGSGFHVLPLLPLLGEDAPFVVVTLTANDACVYRGARFDLLKVDDVPVPHGVEQIAAETDYQNTLHSAPPARHAGRRGSSVSMVKTHNFGEDPEEQRKAQLITYLQRVAAGLDEWMGSGQVPVVLVAQPEIRGNFKALGRFDREPLLELDVNPDAIAPDELHRRAYEAVRPLVAREADEKVEHFKSLFNDGSAKSTDKVEGIVKAARYGQVDVLLARRGTRLWGRYDEQADKVLVHGEPDDEDEDLIDRAAKDTLRHGGRVFLVDEGVLRQGQSAGAILRFEQPR